VLPFLKIHYSCVRSLPRIPTATC